MNAFQHGDGILVNLHKTLELSLKYGIADDAPKYNELAKNVCKLEHGFTLGLDIVKEAAKEATIETFDQVLDDYRNGEQPKFKPQTSKRYTDFVKTTQRLIDAESGESSQSAAGAQTVNDSMDVDEPQTGVIVPDIDPITKTPMERPVRNKHCNHIYGYNSVERSLQRNPRLRCPIVGCPRKDYIKIADLIEEEELAQCLAKQRKQKRKH